MKRNLITAVIAVLAMILTAVPAAGEGPFPPDAWEHTAQFSGDRLYASFEWASGDIYWWAPPV